MGSSSAVAARIAAFKLAVSGAGQFKDALPKEAADKAAALTAKTAEIEVKNAKQEALKAELKKVTKDLAADVKAGVALRGAIVRMAEAVHGHRAPEMQAYRSKTEGKA